MLFIVALVTFVAWTPSNVETIVILRLDDLGPLRTMKWISAALFGLQLTNGFTTPIIYFSFDEHFKVCIVISINASARVSTRWCVCSVVTIHYSSDTWGPTSLRTSGTYKLAQISTHFHLEFSPHVSKHIVRSIFWASVLLELFTIRVC